ncbi:hypothetical protein [Alkaliphilus transvaalensis]|uniref:hypothetical protein n=1 Tax=Alkaliphilus transvaalensis TaxID=114628 RepID=UPI0004793DE1|nr:hypothetical protein [Alkaliphilus transvaalensis]
MGISKYNAEGYYDPTAYEGVRRAEESMKVLKIVYPTGYMEINLDYFFPCTLDKARKVCSLIHRYSTESDKDRLQKYLQGKERMYYSKMSKYADKASSYPENSKEHREYLSKFKEARRLHQRIKRNREIFEMGRDSR